MSDKKKFNEVVVESLHGLAEDMLADIPELEGLVIGIVYSDGLEETKPNVLVVGDVNDPFFIGKAGLQAARVSQTVMAATNKHFQLALQVREQLQEEIDGKRREAEGAKEGEAADRGDSDPEGPARPSKDN